MAPNRETPTNGMPVLEVGVSNQTEEELLEVVSEWLDMPRQVCRNKTCFDWEHSMPRLATSGSVLGQLKFAAFVMCDSLVEIKVLRVIVLLHQSCNMLQ